MNLLLDKLPGKLKTGLPPTGASNSTQARAYGPITFQRYEGTWNGQELTLEVWPIRDAAGTGIENIVEVSFKTDDAATVSGLRNQLLQLLQNKTG